MTTSLHQRLAGLRGRIDALKEGRPPASGLWDQVRARFVAPAEVPKLPLLHALDRDLDRAGVHTSADARLLRALGVERGIAGALAQGLFGRAREAAEELEEAVGGLEAALLAGRLPAGAAAALDRAWPRAARILKVADIFAAPEEDAPSFELYPPPKASPPPPQSARVAVARFWAERARGAVADVVQRRRDLDAAHELLLRLGSDTDREEVRRLRLEVSDARQRVRDVPPVRSLGELVRHVRKVAKTDPARAFGALRGLYDRAVEAHDAQVAQRAFGALGALLGDGEVLRARLESDDGTVAPLIAPSGPSRLTGEEALEERLLLDVALELGERGLEAFELAAGCRRYFDVEDALGEEVITVEAAERRPRPRRVPYPTEHMEFEQGRGFHELRDFVISDPRLLLFDVASGRQRVRAWLEPAPPPEPRRARRSAVRVYVCDASGSMHGARARFRDALLLAELNDLRTRAHEGRPFDPLYFCFFNDVASTLERVDGALAASRQMRRLLLSSPANGQTDITLALIQAFDSIRQARGADPYLARATVVLVTDGEDRVDLAQIRAARAPVDALEISLSFIALGEENRDLRSLVHEQREQGGRAFYVHLSDKEILLARTGFDSRRRTLLPPDLPVTRAALRALFEHLAALEAVARGEAPSEVVSPGAFAALFPEPGPPAAPAHAADPTAHRVVDILKAIAEAAGLAPAEDRAKECVRLLHHLLDLYEVGLPTWLEVLASGAPGTAEALGRIRLLAG